MVAIIEGRDPELVEDAYASTRSREEGFRPSQPEIIEPAAKKVHMISEKIEAPEETAQPEAARESAPADGSQPSDDPRKPADGTENDSSQQGN